MRDKRGCPQNFTELVILVLVSIVGFSFIPALKLFKVNNIIAFWHKKIASSERNLNSKTP